MQTRIDVRAAEQNFPRLHTPHWLPNWGSLSVDDETMGIYCNFSLQLPHCVLNAKVYLRASKVNWSWRSRKNIYKQNKTRIHNESSEFSWTGNFLTFFFVFRSMLLSRIHDIQQHWNKVSSFFSSLYQPNFISERPAARSFVRCARSTLENFFSSASAAEHNGD